jgi:polyadenylation factor subunit 2
MDREYQGHGYHQQYQPANYDPTRPKLKRLSIRGISLHELMQSGATTDYGSTIVQWLRHRRPRDKRSVLFEAERPSPSYIVDVRAPYVGLP